VSAAAAMTERAIAGRAPALLALVLSDSEKGDLIEYLKSL